MYLAMNQVLRLLLYISLVFFLALMINITLPYLTLQNNVAFLRIKQWIVSNRIWLTSFYIHVFTSSFCLLAGFTQFSTHLLKKQPTLHRNLGYMYVSTIIFLSGPSGLIISFYANGGIMSQTAFALLAMLWLATTYLGFHYAKKGDFMQHRKYLIRSYAFTLSAVTLRSWKYIIVLFFRPHPMDLYQLVAWLGWVPNIILAEILIRYSSKTKSFLK